VGERALAVFSVDESPIFEIAKREAHRNTTHAKSAAKLVLACDRKRSLVISSQYLFCEGGNESSSGGGQTLGGH
jgi:hypothetical protein